MTEALESYANTNQHLSAFKEQGLIKAYASAEQFLISPEEQQKRLERWNQYWGESGKDINYSQIHRRRRPYLSLPGR